LINKWKEESENLLVLDAGDLLYPRVSESPTNDRKEIMNLKAEAIVAAFNYMSCDAITIGQDDLLWGKENLLGVLNEAEFPVVSANLMDSRSGKPLFRPYAIKQVRGLKVGIFGLLSRPGRGTEGGFSDCTVLDPLVTAQKMVSTLRKKTDFIILLSNLGYAKDLELARKVEGINVIVGGHTGVNLSYPRIIRNTVVLQIAKRGRYLGRLDITIHDLSRPFINLATMAMLRRRVDGIDNQLKRLDNDGTQESEKKRSKRETLKRRKAETERILKLYEGHNEMTNRIVPLTENVAKDAECGRILKAYLDQIAEAEKAFLLKAGSSSRAPTKRPE